MKARLDQEFTITERLVNNDFRSIISGKNVLKKNNGMNRTTAYCNAFFQNKLLSTYAMKSLLLPNNIPNINKAGA